MLVNVLLILSVAGFCHGKAFPEESEGHRSKRVYNHGENAEFYQSYDPLSSANNWAEGSFYNPQIDRQPIYVPAVNQPGSYNEFLDNYYKSYTPMWTLATPVPYAYDGKSDYFENPATVNSMVKNILETDGHRGNYVLPVTKQSQLKDKMKTDMQHYTSEVSDKIINTNPGTMKSKYSDDEYEEPILHKPLKKNSVKLKEDYKKYVTPEMEDHYERPVSIKTYKKKTGKKDTKTKNLKNHSMSKSSEYENPVVYKTVKQKKIKSNKQKGTNKSSTATYGDHTNRPIRKKSNVKSKKQSQILKRSGVIDESVPIVDIGSTLNLKAVDTVLNEFTKNKIDQSLDNYEPVDTFIIKEKVKSVPKNSLIKTKEKVVVKSDSNDYPAIIEKVKSDPKDNSVKKEKVVVKSHPNDHPVIIKERVKFVPKDNPVRKEKIMVKSDSKDNPIKMKENVVVKSDPNNYPTKTEGIDLSNSVKTKEKVVVKSDPDNHAKTNEITSTESDLEYSVKETGDTPPKSSKDKLKNPQYTGEDDLFKSLEDVSFEDESTNFDEAPESFTEDQFSKNKLGENALTNIDKGEQNLDTDDLGNGIENTTYVFPNSDDMRRLSSLNSNIWSLMFNPNAERHKLKKCVTRNNETGFCTYIQNCDVPNLATSLEQLLNTACVIDDIFIGVCCPEFPVETVKVHWEQIPSDSDKRIEDEFGHNAEDCGIRSNEASELQSWPWKAPLVSMSNGKIFCGGVLISEDHVLTAAHCTTKIPKNQILVRLGQYDDSTGDDYAVVEIKRHAQYNSRTLQNDIALLKLGRRIIHDAHTGIICLPEEQDDDDHNEEKATLLGWRGMFGTKSKDLENLEVMSNKECEKKLGTKVPGTLLCTEARNENERTCNADSGAPLVIEDDDKYEVIGILSWNRNDCDQRFPSTFSRVSSYTAWIKQHI